MSSNLTLIIPSRGRIESLRRCVNSALAYAKDDIEVIVFFDGCDDEPCFNAYKAPSSVTKYVASYDRIYYVAVMNYALECLDLNFDDKDLFVTANNDQEFIEPGWDQIAIDALYSKFDDGKGVVEIGNHEDLAFNTFISRVSFWTKHYDGQLFDPRFKQYFADKDRVRELDHRGHLARLAPGLVNTHSIWDEVKHEGLKCWAADKEAYDDKQIDIDLMLP